MAVTLRCAAYECAVTSKMTLSLILSAYRGAIQTTFSCASISCPLFLNQILFKTCFSLSIIHDPISFGITYDEKKKRQANEAGKNPTKKIHSSFASTEREKRIHEMEQSACLS